jgi:hypothetical protein
MIVEDRGTVFNHREFVLHDPEAGDMFHLPKCGLSTWVIVEVLHRPKPNVKRYADWEHVPEVRPATLVETTMYWFCRVMGIKVKKVWRKKDWRKKEVAE